jgi:hypothetical protein
MLIGALSGRPVIDSTAPIALAADRELIAGTRAHDLARAQLGGRGLGVDAGVAKADDRVRAPGDDPDRNRLAAGRRVDGVDPEGGERSIHRPGEHRHQVRLP